MGQKPRITSQSQLTPHYLRYREMLCAGDPRLDARLRGGNARRVPAFRELAARYDAILFDAFGVLNRGSEAIPGAAETLTHLHRQGVPFLIISNNASQAPERIAGKLAKRGFPVGADHIVASGMAVAPHVAASPWRDRPYYLIGTGDSRDAYAPDPGRLMVNNPGAPLPLAAAEYLLMCSNRDYYGLAQEREVEALLAERPRPVLLANPDLVAPDEAGGVYAVAGYTTAELARRFPLEVVGLGKPFPPIFQQALERLPPLPPERILMVGDTLDTDILGGAAMGFATCLTLSGVYQGEEEQLPELMHTRGIRPDFIVESIA